MILEETNVTKLVALLAHTKQYESLRSLQERGVTFSGAGGGAGFGAGSGAGPGAAVVVLEASGTCGPLRRPFNLLNMSRNLKVHLPPR